MENNKYMVKVLHAFSSLLEVEANSKEEAIEIAKNELSSGDSSKDLKMYYDATMAPEEWSVISKDEFLKLKEEVTAAMNKEQEEKSNIITP